MKNLNQNLNLNLNQVLTILLRALDYIDVRLVDHGHRVAYLVYKMMQTEGSYSEEEMQEIAIISALHDIGAYKTEEIDHMMGFESNHVFDHSIYGYLFLKFMSPLAQWAEIVLYHHLDYEFYDKMKLDCKYLNVVDMIHLADRMDVILQVKEQWPEYEEIAQQQNLRFGKDTIDLFYRANERQKIEEHIKNGSYLKELKKLVSNAQYTEQTLLDFIKMIAYSIDFRSETTVSHVVSTASISVALGKVFRLDELELKKIELGAYLHDIGKISTPLEILEKPGGLTQEEMQIMRGHINMTGEILKGRIHDDIYHIAYRHHEKSDGCGYPLQLKAEQLTLNDEIVAVADMMSALTGKRSYKDSFSKEVVIDILKKQKEEGKLNGQIVNEVISHYDEIMECSNANIRIITTIYNSIKSEFNLIKQRFEALK